MAYPSLHRFELTFSELVCARIDCQQPLIDAFAFGFVWEIYISYMRINQEATSSMFPTRILGGTNFEGQLMSETYLT